ncbi:hypothetical protein DOTSEDRAFT_75237 [Dothistroma septosporum NZE10]|uniref:Uncharacterized protein n=1 Tax=Dothistroma septosporum (strain NZE10 / CBS 128990) TaxID=675120 RepID=M2YKK1_DOTSN|nr:hypothetical protein DOTSEDRAFT_75237 [Dothistroma septosporum NZE10]
MLSRPVLVHYCDSCNYNTPVKHTGSVREQDHICTHCGVKQRGADVVGESKGAMNSMQQDDLAQLFAQSMQLQQPATIQQQPVFVELVQPMSGKTVEAPIHYASAHYTPNSAHMRAETQSEPAQSPPPPYREALMPDAMADVLRQNSIDPLALLPNQVDLFLNADYEQRLRLLELWRISPPSYPHEQQAQQQWMNTSVEKEEHAARDRYEQQMQQRSACQEKHMFDTFVPKPESQAPVRLRSASSSAGTVTIKPMEAEPYIINGYEIAAASPRAVEPVYAAAGMWSAPRYEATLQQARLEDQYGMIDQIRCHADWERMNQQQFHGMHGPVEGVDSMDMEL